MTNVPPHWKLVALGDLGDEVKGSVRPEPGIIYEHYSVPAYANGAPTLEDGSEIKSGKRPVEPGDLLVSKINPRINRVWMVGEDRGIPQIASTEYLVLRVPDEAGGPLRRWLTWYLRSPDFRAWIKLNVEGATGSHTRAKSPAILAQEVPVAPLDEQRRIVEAIETHLSHLDAGVESLQRAKRGLGGLRLAVLAAEFGSVDGSTGTPIKEMLATNIGGVWGDPPGMGEADVPVARITEFRADGTVDVASGTIRAITRRQLTSRRLQAGDLLLEKSGGGPRQPVGRVARVMSDSGDAVCGNFVQLMRPDPEMVEPGYLYWVLTWLYGSGVAARFQTASTNIRNLKTQDYLGLRTPLPSLSSQRAAVARIEVRFGVLKHTASEVRVIERRSSGLRAAILAAAFSGRLAQNQQGAAA